MKFVLLAFILVVAAFVFFGLGRRRPRPPAKTKASQEPNAEQAGAPAPRSRDAAAASVSPMVACAHCGVHLPSAEAVIAGAQSFCSPAHRDAAARGKAADRASSGPQP